MAFLTKAQILAAQDRKFVDVAIPEWGGTVRIGSMTAGQRDRYETMFIRFRNGGGDGAAATPRAALVAMCAVDDKGNPLFDGPDDVAKLADKCGTAIDRLFVAATKLNVMTEEAAETQKGN